MAKLTPKRLRRFARLGAIARLEELRAEEAAIRAEFPELFGRGSRRAEVPAPGAARRRRRRRRKAGASA